MARIARVFYERYVPGPFARKTGVKIPIATKLILSFLLVIGVTSLVFIAVGIHLIGNRVVAEAQEKVRNDLNAAREIYLAKLGQVDAVVRFTAGRFFLRNALLAGDIEQATQELVQTRQRERLDIFNVTDASGNVLLRTNNVLRSGDNQSHNEIVKAVMETGEPVAGTVIVSVDDLRKESRALADQAYFRFIDTPKARPRPETEETSGMMLMAAAPIQDYQGNLLGILYGGILLNRDFDIVDTTKRTVFKGLKYNGKDIGTATIFQDDVRISTNVETEDGTRAIGTRVSQEVYDYVVNQGGTWIGRAYVVNDWYITAYEPIRDINNRIIGILYVGILEQKYLDIRQRTILVFLAIALLGVLISVALSYFLSRGISGSIKRLVSASEELAQGNLDARVEIESNDELKLLADSFNAMASALKARDQQIKEFARNRIMESERLALIGQLAAGVAHELNNPLQGIVAYSHLLLERTPCEDPRTASLRKIVTQADRCTEIIRGLLDFSRQNKPKKTLVNINHILLECVSLVEQQALFHNIEIEKDFIGNLPLIPADPSQMQQVFMNMIINAAEAMDGKGRLTLETRYDPRENCVDVIFSDTGHGIKEEDMPRLFDPFFTTKEVGHGTGLGLAISYGIIRAHKGTIHVESEVGKGTTFIISLPATADEKR
ncbi:MAG: cache domain-containing protein [Anaerolineae bacterium]